MTDYNHLFSKVNLIYPPYPLPYSSPSTTHMHHTEIIFIS